jgi:hypothetical protein
MIHLPFLHPLHSLLRSLFHPIRGWPLHRPAPLALVAPCHEAEMELPEALEARPVGCGWFDSSYELGQGLQVQEHDQATAAQALAAMPLADWLELHLGTWHSSTPAVAQA